jgi:hypothetical protein
LASPFFVCTFRFQTESVYNRHMSTSGQSVRSLIEGLPAEIAKRVHPDWQKNETEYWVQRDTLLRQYAGQWIGFAEGRVIACGTSPVEVFHAASMRLESEEGEDRPKNPIRGTFPGCCASANGQSTKSKAMSAKTKDVRVSSIARFHRITLSALASTSGGIVTPICFAVFRLMTNSNFVGCWTGKSAGLVPFRILST